MSITPFYQVSEHGFRAPSLDETRVSIDQAEALAHKVSKAETVKHAFVFLGLALGAAALVVGGVFTGGLLHLAIPVLAKIVGGTVLGVAGALSLIKAYKVQIPRMGAQGQSMQAFLVPNCRRRGKLFALDEDRVTANLRCDLEQDGLEIRVHGETRTEEYVSASGVDPLKAQVYSHFLSCSKSDKQAHRRQLKLLNQVTTKGKESALRSILKKVAKKGLQVRAVHTQVHLHLYKDQEKIQTFTVLEYYQTNDEKELVVDAVPILIEEDYRSAKQIVLFQVTEDLLMPKKTVPLIEGVLKRHRPSVTRKNVDDATLDGSISAMRKEIERDLGRMGSYDINERIFLLGDEQIRDRSEYMDDVIQNLTERGYSKKQIILILSQLHQGVNRPAVDYFTMDKNTPFDGTRYYSLQFYRGDDSEVEENSKKNLSIEARLYGPGSKDDYVECAYTAMLIDSKDPRTEKEKIQQAISVRYVGRYTLHDQKFSAVSRVIQNVPHPVAT